MPFTSEKNYRPLFYFILGWIAVNVLQAIFTGLDGDETYYWTYSQHLQWGYFDHPPMVALSISLGELFGHGPLFTRAGTILLSAGTIYFGFKALPDHLKNARFYILVFASVLLFHVYSFVTTPDPPLLFFTAVFFYAYKQFLKSDHWTNIAFLGLSILGLIYSKYHGVLPVFFTFLSNPRLALKRSAWVVVLLVIAGFIPHLYWQYMHDWPTVRYHLFERNRGSYKIEKTTNYILGQLLIFGPLTTVLAYYLFFKRKLKGDVYLRAHAVNFIGVLLFFLFSSFKKNIEPHWTLVAGVSFVVLVMHVLHLCSKKSRKTFFVLAFINIALVVLTRFLIAIPGSPAEKIDRVQVQIFSRSWADSLYRKAAGTPVVFVDNYTYPSLYKYYHPDQLSTCYSTVYYRKNNYTLQDHAAFNNKAVFTVRRTPIASNDIEVESDYVPTFLHKVDSFKAITGLKIQWVNKEEEAKAGSLTYANVVLSNPLDYTINGRNLLVNYTFLPEKGQYKTSENFVVKEAQLQPGFSKHYSLPVQFPTDPGKYRLIFSFDQPLLGPTFASPFYQVEIK